MVSRQQFTNVERITKAAEPKSAGTTVVDWAIQVLRTGIMQGRYAPGQRLVEADLMNDLSISRTPVREALRRLGTEGLVTLEPYRGAVVCRLTREGMESTFQVREVLESLAARLCAERVRDGELRPKNFERKLRALGTLSDDADTFLEQNDRFHSYMMELSGNTHVHRLLSQARTPALRMHFPALLTRDLVETSAGEHQELTDAICAGQPAVAVKIMQRHIRRTAKLAQQRLPDYLFPVSR